MVEAIQADPEALSDDQVDLITGYEDSDEYAETDLRPADIVPQGPQHGDPLDLEQGALEEARQETPLEEEVALPAEQETSEQASEESELLAGKYRSAQELEKGYRQTSAESTRLSQELSTTKEQLSAVKQQNELLARVLQEKGFLPKENGDPAAPPRLEKPPLPEVTTDQFWENPLKYVEQIASNLAQHAAESKASEILHAQSQAAEQQQEALKLLEESFLEEAKTHGQMQRADYGDYTGYIQTDADVASMVGMGNFSGAARLAHMLWQQEHGAPQSASKKQASQAKKQAAYVEGSRRAGRAPETDSQAARRMVDEIDVTDMSPEVDAALDLALERELGVALPDSVRLSGRRAR